MPKVYAFHCEWRKRDGRCCGKPAMAARRYFMDTKDSWFMVRVCRMHAHRIDSIRFRFKAPWGAMGNSPLVDQFPKSGPAIDGAGTSAHPAKAGERLVNAVLLRKPVGNHSLGTPNPAPSARAPGDAG